MMISTICPPNKNIRLIRSRKRDERRKWHVWGSGWVHAEFWWGNEEDRPLGRPSIRWEDNIKMDFIEIE
jgi:hypothetical protein